jgi:hypothetical protein
MLNLKETEFKTLEEIQKIAPSIFTANGSEKTSARYAHVSTSRVIEDLAKLGWGVVDVKEVKARKNVGYQKHLVVLRNQDITIESKGDVVFPQILISNSHDGKNAFTFRAGLFRLVCENGLVVSDQDFEKLSIRHYGYTFEELQKTINAIVEKLPHTVESMNRLKQRQLTEPETTKFAERAIAARFGNDAEFIKVDLSKLLEPTRPEDAGNDLWSVFNVIQEKLIHGMFDYTYGTESIAAKMRKARKVKNFNQDMVINTKLYDLAMEFCN